MTVTHSPPASFLIGEATDSSSKGLLALGVPLLLVGRKPDDALGCSIGRPDGVVGLDPGVGDMVLELTELATMEAGRGIPLAGVLGAAEGAEKALGGALLFEGGVATRLR